MPADMKAIIAQAFKELAQQKSIDKITVKSLIESCGISRQTFYYHFQDIMDVISWSLQQASEETLARSIKAGTPREALRLLISDVSENRSMIIRLLDSQRRSEIEALFVRTARGSLQEILRQRPVTLPFPYTNLETGFLGFRHHRAASFPLFKGAGGCRSAGRSDPPADSGRAFLPGFPDFFQPHIMPVQYAEPVKIARLPRF